MRAREQGFTLLEMLAALILLALLGTVAARTLTGGAKAQRHLEHVQLMAEFAQSKLDELRLAAPVVGNSHGIARNGVHWQLQIAPVTTPQDNLQELGVRLKVAMGAQYQLYQTSLLKRVK